MAVAAPSPWHVSVLEDKVAVPEAERRPQSHISQGASAQGVPQPLHAWRGEAQEGVKELSSRLWLDTSDQDLSEQDLSSGAGECEGEGVPLSQYFAASEEERLARFQRKGPTEEEHARLCNPTVRLGLVRGLSVDKVFQGFSARNGLTRGASV